MKKFNLLWFVLLILFVAGSGYNVNAAVNGWGLLKVGPGDPDPSVIINAYPNPFVDNFVLQIASNAPRTVSIRIMNDMGRIMTTQTVFLRQGETWMRFNLKGAPIGPYSVQVFGPSSSGTLGLSTFSAIPMGNSYTKSAFSASPSSRTSANDSNYVMLAIIRIMKTTFAGMK